MLFPASTVRCRASCFATIVSTNRGASSSTWFRASACGSRRFTCVTITSSTRFAALRYQPCACGWPIVSTAAINPKGRSPMKYLLEFEEPLAVKAEHSGGKGANLALLTQRGFPVPPGFIVTAQAYRDFISTGREHLSGVHAFPFHAPAKLKAESEILRAKLAQLPLPAALVDEVKTRLRDHAASQAFSVRSSSTMEDLASAAFAGQHDTYLNCSGAEQILEKIKSCFLSLWHDRAMAYRQQHGFDHLLAVMAVVVQNMVQSEVAGVGFSINPINGDLSEMIVNANFGLGESVVSGEGEVDHFEIDKSTRTVGKFAIARKTRKIVGVAGGTEEVRIADGDAERPCLGVEQISQLADLLIRVERSYSFPQDIEWGFAEGRLHLL